MEKQFSLIGVNLYLRGAQFRETEKITTANSSIINFKIVEKKSYAIGANYVCLHAIIQKVTIV